LFSIIFVIDIWVKRVPKINCKLLSASSQYLLTWQHDTVHCTEEAGVNATLVIPVVRSRGKFGNVAVKYVITRVSNFQQVRNVLRVQNYCLHFLPSFYCLFAFLRARYVLGVNKIWK